MTIAQPHCPAVPRPQNGTVGQSTNATDLGGTKSGTASRTPSLKALALQVLARDKGRDSARDSGSTGGIPAVRRAGHADGGKRDSPGAVPQRWPPRPAPEPRTPAEVLARVGTWPEGLIDLFEERSAIMEHDGHMLREAAERIAYDDLKWEVGKWTA
jgi:hypothetical protein